METGEIGDVNTPIVCYDLFPKLLLRPLQLIYYGSWLSKERFCHLIVAVIW